jgi:hypothetical protein
MSSPDLVALSLAAASAPIVKEAAARLETTPAADGPILPAALAKGDLGSVEIDDGFMTLSRVAIGDGEESPLESTSSRAVTRAGVALDPDVVFSDARKRIERVFRLNVILLLALAVLLLIGIGGAIYSALVWQQNMWTLIFGGVAVADVIGIYVFKPITAINRALVSTQQLDLLYLRLREGLKGCEELQDVNEKLACRDALWDKVWEDLSALSEIA